MWRLQLNKIFVAISFILLITLSTSSIAQNGSIIKDAPNIYFDCQRCDIDFVKKEVNFVNFVRDRKDADVHIFTSSQHTGGLGREFTLTFLGQNRFEGINDTLKFFEDQTDTEDTERIKLVNTFKLGLLRYIIDSPIAKKLSIKYIDETKEEDKSTDDWDFWVYRVSLHGFMRGEESSSYVNTRSSLSASRVTEEWKIHLSLNSDYNESRYDYEDEMIKNIRRSYSWESSIVKSLGSNWSVGVLNNLNSSSYRNIEFAAEVASGIEYNIFPYSESTHKQLRLNYIIWAKHNNYLEETIYLKLRETLFRQSISATLELIQPWGNVSTSISGSSYFHDFTLNHIEIESEVTVNIYKGLSLEFDGGISAIHDQIALPKRDVSLEEVLLQRRELETQFEFWGSFGFSYSFGSIYNNIVNPRFGD